MRQPGAIKTVDRSAGVLACELVASRHHKLDRTETVRELAAETAALQV